MLHTGCAHQHGTKSRMLAEHQLQVPCTIRGPAPMAHAAAAVTAPARSTCDRRSRSCSRCRAKAAEHPWHGDMSTRCGAQATSALDVATEAALYRRLQHSCNTYISVGMRPADSYWMLLTQRCTRESIKEQPWCFLPTFLCTAPCPLSASNTCCSVGVHSQQAAEHVLQGIAKSS